MGALVTAVAEMVAATEVEKEGVVKVVGGGWWW